ncbi:MAG TPA: glutamine--tRNA ligase/YqeY domain fusion protein [Candidatus Polarisedimenticolaceae bacterium]|nr:glutamine--tRNA ligase/YqeY domain fusion protein [Candidatus Polarisedimenticolaceae bacterium]
MEKTSHDIDAGGYRDFIRQIIDEDRQRGRHGGQVVTRFPPEPNGYLHIGHAKSICLNFGLAREYGGRCNLRFDDTNPAKEEVEYVESIIADVRWLGFDWPDGPYFASDYFEAMYDHAVRLIERGLAYVDELSADEIRAYRGTLTEPGRNSPYRDRPVSESLDLFARMRAGEFEEGRCVLRAKIDMASPNINMRDPALYRIKKAPHHRTGDAWCVYPMYDYAHPLSDALEGITHSICTLEFEDHRPFYDWVVRNCPTGATPQQIEFARLNLSYTVLSKRKLLLLVRERHVAGWDDPRMPTLSGMRRRGFTPEAIRAFCERVGVAKRDSVVDIALLEHAVREDLNRRAPRVMSVLKPLPVVVENYPEGQVEEFELQANPENPASGLRKVPFSRNLFIEEDDFRETPPPKYYRLSPGSEVRLRGAYFLTCTGVERDAYGNVASLRCTYDPASRGGSSPDGRKVKSTIHWVSAEHSVPATVRLYESLFSKESPDDESDGTDWRAHLNPRSLTTLIDARIEAATAKLPPGTAVQFERLGYFCVDADSTPEAPVFDRTITLKDAWARIEKKARG